MPNLRFWPTLLAITFIAIFINLGFWQLRRYDYKIDLIQQYTQAAHAAPMSLSQLQKEHDKRFQHVTEQGHYINQYTMLLVNRIQDSDPGAEVITPVQIDGSKKLLLVNRGWVPADARTQHPVDAITAPVGLQTIAGYIKYPDAHNFILGGVVLKSKKKPLQIQKIDIRALEKETHLQFYPYVLRLDKQQAHGYQRNWQLMTMKPAKHFGYAIQWFLMAFVLMIAYLIFCYRR